MKIDAFRLGLATAIIFAVVWVICAVLVYLMPSGMMQMSGHMLHADLGGMGWSMHWAGFLTGLVLWTLLPALLVAAIAAVYNRLVG